LLGRLALGTLIPEHHGPMPCVLDDSLPYADDTRIDLMFDAFTRAARAQQMIVLSCHARSFAGLGGNPLLVEELP
jgi:uncharacterized protein YhaN